MIDNLKDFVEKEKEAQEKQDGKGTSYKNTKEYKEASGFMKQSGVDPSSMGSGGGIPKLPSGFGGGFKLPSF